MRGILQNIAAISKKDVRVVELLEDVTKKMGGGGIDIS